MWIPMLGRGDEVRSRSQTSTHSLGPLKVEQGQLNVERGCRFGQHKYGRSRRGHVSRWFTFPLRSFV